MREPETVTWTDHGGRAGGPEVQARGKHHAPNARGRLGTRRACLCLALESGSDESGLFLRPLQGAFLIPPVLPVVLIGANRLHTRTRGKRHMGAGALSHSGSRAIVYELDTLQPKVEGFLTAIPLIHLV